MVTITGSSIPNSFVEIGTSLPSSLSKELQVSLVFQFVQQGAADVLLRNICITGFVVVVMRFDLDDPASFAGGRGALGRFAA